MFCNCAVLQVQLGGGLGRGRHVRAGAVVQRDRGRADRQASLPGREYISSIRYLEALTVVNVLGRYNLKENPVITKKLRIFVQS